jgi:hypothetical protein
MDNLYYICGSNINSSTLNGMKHIKVRALYFKAVKPAMKELDVDDDLYNALCDGAPEEQVLQLLGISYMASSVRRIQIQCDGKLIYNSPNRASVSYSCDTRPW